MLVLSLGLLVGAPVRAQEEDPPSGRVVDRVVAVIGGKVLTQSELELEARIAMVRKGAVRAASEALDEPVLRTSLDLVVGTWLANDEADRLSAVRVQESEVEAALVSFKEKMGGERPYARFLADQDADNSQVRSVLARALRAERFLDSKVRLKAQVSETEVREEYDAHREDNGPDYAAARGRLREMLIRKKYQALIERELAAARRGAEVRWIAPWAKPTEGGR